MKWAKYPELNVKNLLEQIKDDEELLSYFPDREDLEKEINRNFAYTVFATLRPTAANKILSEARMKRNKTI